MSYLEDLDKRNREEVRLQLAAKGLLVGDRVQIRREPFLEERGLAGKKGLLHSLNDFNANVLLDEDGTLAMVHVSAIFPEQISATRGNT